MSSIGGKDSLSNLKNIDNYLYMLMFPMDSILTTGDMSESPLLS